MTQTSLPSLDWRDFLETLFGIAVAAAHPKICLPPALPDITEYKSVKVVALGKAAASSAGVLEGFWPDADISGVAIAPVIGSAKTNHIDLIETSHPLPSAKSLRAGKAALDIAHSAGPDDLLLVLLSGGASAAACVPYVNTSLEEKQRITQALLLAGASIQEMNTVRRCLSAFKGGHLAKAGANARKILTLAISDVTGDDPKIIGSGPTVGDDLPEDAAQEILEKYGIDYASTFSKPIASDDPVFEKAEYRIIANAQSAIDTAARFAENMNIRPQILGYNNQGDAEIAGKAQAKLLEKLSKRRRNFPKLFLAGGEYTTKVNGNGAGGPNQHFLLSLLCSFSEPQQIYALSADTDGQDGIGAAAGAWITPETFDQVIAEGLDPQAYLDNSDSFSFFEQLNSIVHASPTHTNINDFRAFLIPPDGQ